MSRGCTEILGSRLEGLDDRSQRFIAAQVGQSIEN